MPQKVIKFGGINRRVNEFKNSGACEELINLRPGVEGGFRVIRPKHKLVSGIYYRQVYEHSFGDTSNIIVVDDAGVIYWIDKTGERKQQIAFIAKDVELAFAGNVLVAYSESKKEQQVFKFENETYEKYDVSFRRIVDAYIEYSPYSYTEGTTYTAVSDDTTPPSLNQALGKAASGFNNVNTNGLCGAAVVGCTYELDDGSEFWSTAFAVANSADVPTHHQPMIGAVDSANAVVVTGALGVKFCIKFAEGEKAKGIKKINVYSTKAVLPYEITGTAESPAIKEVSLEELNLAGQVMHYQGSIDVDGTEDFLSLDFGTELSAEKIMDVLPGCVDRIGNMVSYNNRFHYYRSEIQHVIQAPTVSRAPADSVIDLAGQLTYSEWIAYVKFDKGWKLIDNVYRLVDGAPLDIIYPMIGIEEIAFVKAERTDDGTFYVPYIEMFYVKLKESSAYNYSYAFNVKPSIEDGGHFEADMESANQVWGRDFVYDKKVFWKKETNSINVSAQYNPFVFPVEYSYLFSGEIRDITTSYIPISATQIGQYPITVFTTNGIYSLEQGNGAVLYVSTVPLQPLVIEGKAVATPYGTFFKSSKNLYVISGREVANMSAVLDGERETAIRDLDAYKVLCRTYGVFHDFSFSLSREDFDEHIVDATLAYDPLQNELYINSGHPNHKYSYVLNLDTKMYHKVSRRYYVAQNGGRYAIEEIGNNELSVVSLHDEDKTTQPILLQSRPLSLEEYYTHIQRLLMHVDVHLQGEQYLCLSVFASDNLYDWKCIMSAQKKETILRQIRTNKAPKSYRDYIILITGMVDTNTDLSDLIADYTVVNRRLG